ncbi:unnamed protein product [Acanthosepion pharaonis]|uniref:Uncharacterized protein n=1 Tax=Acanthosepion pharaonis TaxID=158019 RepID=A0A812DMD7_ACAPH|nr:unnamed protein product [Sepia pharaonis]
MIYDFTVQNGCLNGTLFSSRINFFNNLNFFFTSIFIQLLFLHLLISPNLSLSLSLSPTFVISQYLFLSFSRSPHLSPISRSSIVRCLSISLYSDLSLYLFLRLLFYFHLSLSPSLSFQLSLFTPLSLSNFLSLRLYRFPTLSSLFIFLFF